MRFSDVSAMMRRYAACNSGATLPLVGLVFLVLVSAVGMAVDYGRAQMVQSKMQAALDSAALAAATAGNCVGLKEAELKSCKLREANKYMEANFPVGYMSTLYPQNGDGYVTDLQILDNGNGLSLSAAGQVETTTMGVFGISTMDVKAHTEIALETGRYGLEVVLVLDNTGSMNETMGGESKLTALKRASKALVNDIYAKFDPEKTFIGIVPFGNKVNVGMAQAPGTKWLRDSEAGDNPVSGQVGCLYTDSTYGSDFTGHAPSRDMRYAFGAQTPVKGKTPSALFYGTQPFGTPHCKTASMRPLTNDVNALRTAIDSMVGDGYTRIDLGAVWGWRMLLPQWRGLWNHAFWKGGQLPVDFDTKDMSKVVIILTDGRNQDPSRAVETRADSNLTSVCNSMRASEIIVYTVTLHEMSAATLMRNCATSTSHYFHVAPGQSLENTFRQIAASLANLRISR